MDARAVLIVFETVLQDCDVCDNLKRAVFAENPFPTTLADLRIGMAQEWDNIPQDL